jgi:uncharacterized protein (TIGR03083 family)
VDVNRDDDTLAAWALDALDVDELAAIDMALDVDPARARVAAPMRRVAAQLAAPLAVPPPGDLRRSILGAARERRPVGATDVELVEPVEVYAAQVERLAEALEAVGHDDADAFVAAYGWTLGRLVRHLRAVERYFLEILRSPDLASAALVPDHLALGDHDDGAPVGVTAREWAASARVAIDIARSFNSEQLEREATFHGVPFRLSTLFVVRGFELWTHTDDVRRALGRPIQAPAEGELRTMSDRAVQGLPGLLLLAGIEPPPVPVRVVLTGRGGGTWDVDLDLEAEPGRPPSGPPRTTLVADVVDFCRLVSRRVEIDELDHDVEGDRDLATSLLRGAQAIAV